MFNTDSIKRRLQMPAETILTKEDFLSTGSTLLNLALTGRPLRGFAKGHYFWLVGDSTSGKTFIAMTCLAEAARNPNFDDHRFIFDNPEQGALMDIERFFGAKVAKRLETPDPSETVDDLYYNIDDTVTKGPCIYILDSMDALSSEAEQKKFKKRKTAHQKGDEAKGSYTDAKAKTNSAGIRSVLPKLRKTGSILILISQTRDNIGFGAMFEPKRASGGRSLKFYATAEIWTSVKGKIKTVYKEKKRQQGIWCSIQVKKNRFTGRDRGVVIPILHSFGIDDTGSCVDYLIGEKHWPVSRGIVTVDELNFKGSKEKLIREIEKKNLGKDLRRIAGECWNEIEDAIKVKRERRYQ
jgi:RecA/RadA recombinase